MGERKIESGREIRFGANYLEGMVISETERPKLTLPNSSELSASSPGSGIRAGSMRVW
jgi:hypothetical protein